MCDSGFKCFISYLIGSILVLLAMVCPVVTRNLVEQIHESDIVPHYALVTDFSQTYSYGGMFEKGVTYYSYVTAKLDDTNQVVSFEEVATSAHACNYPVGSKIVVYEYDGRYQADTRSFFRSEWYTVIIVVFLVAGTIFLIRGRMLYNSERY